MVGRLTDGFTKGERLSKASDNYDDLPAIQNSCYSNGQSHPWNSGYVVVEETGIYKDCIVSQGFNPRSRWERRSYAGYISEYIKIR